LSLEQWDDRYRAGEHSSIEPSPLVMRFASELKPGRAFDLACGAGRNSLYLAEQGWRVSAVDGSSVAIQLLEQRARQRKLVIDARVADLDAGQFTIDSNAYDLICDCYYLQRNLFPAMQSGVRPGGIVVAIVHLPDRDDPQDSPKRAYPGELAAFFAGWKILHSYEGASREACHKRPVAELVAQKPEK
jgi:tellurite methyltransferase